MGRLLRKRAVSSNSVIFVTETAVDDPDPAFYENYVCGAMRNYTGYCNPEVDKLVDEQSAESDVAKRKQLVWTIEKKLADDDARPILFYPRAANCHYSKVKGLTTQVNSIYNGYRMEGVWLDKKTATVECTPFLPTVLRYSKCDKIPLLLC